MSAIRWGIAATGGIAHVVAREFARVPGAELVAVGSRTPQRARAFAGDHGIPRAHGSYRDLVTDPEVDVVYVATPHPQHHRIALAALRAGKAILVEKAFTATLAGATEVVQEARRRELFAMEAMWTRFLPAVVRLRELVREGAIGSLFSVQADLGFARMYDPAHRLFARELGGGALLDIGVYAVSFAQMLLGSPQTVAAVGGLELNGTDAGATLLLGFEDGRSATLTTSFHSPLPGFARVFGADGWIDVPPRFHHPSRIVVHRAGADPEPIDLPPDGVGYAHQLAEVTRCMQAGRTESDAMPLDDTLAVMAVLEEAGRCMGVSWREDARVDV